MTWGGFLHEEVLLKPVAEGFDAAGGTVHLEFFVQVGRKRGFVDCLVEIGAERIAVEVEYSPERVRNDVRKAEAACARPIRSAPVLTARCDLSYPRRPARPCRILGSLRSGTKQSGSWIMLRSRGYSIGAGPTCVQ